MNFAFLPAELFVEPSVVSVVMEQPHRRHPSGSFAQWIRQALNPHFLVKNKFDFIMLSDRQFSFAVLSAFENVGQQLEIESRIIASSVQPPAGKLVEPVVVVFGGVQVIILSHDK